MSTLAGTAIRCIMLTSGYCVARAVWAIRVDQIEGCLLWLSAALITGPGCFGPQPVRMTGL